MVYNGAQTGFQELQLTEKIYHQMAGHPAVELINPEVCDSIRNEHSEFAGRYFDRDLMVEMAELAGARYLVWINVEESDIRKSARTWIPYIFRSHHRKCVLSIRMFVVDAFNGKTVLARYYSKNKRGPAVMSYLDYDPDDPGLIQSYSEVREKFNELEEEISEEIAEELVHVVYRR
jgi:fructoselysine-6-P-deglycase FrlB-like protein